MTNLESRFTDLPIISCFALFDPSQKPIMALQSLQIGFNIVQTGVDGV